MPAGRDAAGPAQAVARWAAPPQLPGLAKPVLRALAREVWRSRTPELGSVEPGWAPRAGRPALATPVSERWAALSTVVGPPPLAGERGERGRAAGVTGSARSHSAAGSRARAGRGREEGAQEAWRGAGAGW